uniref:phosphatidylinositol transfer protein 3-like n=1 Tax=Erigeron canadensis TaxID=72917 RepID=UPI001CB898C5|nr:phosphatidylinositol transfer protein 3-like [Erigeron canadensis]XP_043606204.1 phosphatidylinositol transfer protein 3-like [Erigeron canadensis]XP_043606206.1 phosphatidylinositol transfer protein 3-like [Erigeron canadensis]
MNPQLKKSSSNGPLSPEDQQKMIAEVREMINKHTSCEKIKKQRPDEFSRYCSDASISRYLRARNWNVKKAAKMLEASLKWRTDFKPEEILWEQVAAEAETGKIYRSSYKDKNGRVVLVMRPRFQNSTSIRAQVKYLVYCMENAILNLPLDQEQMIWLIDFDGFKLSNISIKSTKETAFILQDQYPERLGLAIMYNPPKFFEPFYKIVKPFLEPKTANKVKFVYADDPNTKSIMDNLFSMDELESAFGGKDEEIFDIKKYAERMKEDDAKRIALYQVESCIEPKAQPNPNEGNGITTNSLQEVGEEEVLAEGKINGG